MGAAVLERSNAAEFAAHSTINGDLVPGFATFVRVGDKIAVSYRDDASHLKALHTLAEVDTPGVVSLKHPTTRRVWRASIAEDVSPDDIDAGYLKRDDGGGLIIDGDSWHLDLPRSPEATERTVAALRRMVGVPVQSRRQAVPALTR